MDEAHLKSVPLFQGLSKRDRRRMCQLADVVDVPEGKDLVREDEFAYEFFVIEEGSVEVSRREGGHIADLGPGDFFGEMGMLQDLRRNASVVSRTPLTAIVMTSQDFRAMSREMPAVAERIRATVAERTRALG
jgi:cAMP-dependent protein kinase regulator